jgi:hypothetical protein
VEVPALSDAPTKKEAKSKTVTVDLEINPSSGIDVVGDTTPPLLFAGSVFSFTQAEADALLALRNKHGVPIVRIPSDGV